MKRKDYISWDEFFMGVADLASKRSKDPDTRCGACIVNPETNRIISVGYNGLSKGLDDNGINILNEYLPEPFLITQSDGLSYDYWKKPDKYHFSVHAEENAILNCSCSLKELKGCVIYVYSDKGYYPCDRCANDINQVGIVEVIMPFAISSDTPTYNWDYTKHIFKKAGIKIRILGDKNE